MKGLNRIEVLEETLHQCISWAEDNKEQVIDELTEQEVFWENGDGMEWTQTVNLFDTCKQMVEHIRDLSEFINKNFDPSKRLSEGMPALLPRHTT